MRILHVLDHSLPLHSGYTFRTCSILEHQRLLGWETFHLTSAKQNDYSFPVEHVDGFRFYRTPSLSSFISRIPLINQCAIVTSLAKRLNELVKELKPDVIHAHSPALNGIAAIFIGKLHNIRVVYECRGFWEDAAVDHGTTKEGSLRYIATRYLETFVFKHADAVTTICEGLRSDILGRGIPSSKVSIIPNAVDINKFTVRQGKNIDFITSNGLNDKIVLGFIGSYYSYEGLQLLIEALPSIIKQIPHIYLLLVGGGPLEHYLHELTERIHLDDNIRFIGQVPHEMITDYYSLIDILIYPRYPMRLTNLVTPLKMLEAMAQGKLVLASDVGGHKEIIVDGQTGFLFKAGDIDDLIRKILYIINHTELHSEIVTKARKYVEEQRNWSTCIGKYQSVYLKSLT